MSDAPELGTSPASSEPTGGTVAERLARAGAVAPPAARSEGADLDAVNLSTALPMPRVLVDDFRGSKKDEMIVSGLFMLAVVGIVATFYVFFGVDEHDASFTPLLGLALTLGIAPIGLAAVLWAKTLMTPEEAVQDRHDFRSPDVEREAAGDAFARGVAQSGFTKYPMVRRTLLGAVGVLPLAALPFLFKLGPVPKKELQKTSWKTGSRLVTKDGVPVKLGDMAIGGLLNVFPEGGNTGHAAADSVTILIRLRPGTNNPRPGRETWTAQDHIAYSKLCTHLGCPVSLYQQQTHQLLCPCHQSQFEVLDGARPVFGPAARSLPQLAIAIDDEGYFYAQGPYTEAVGASFWERS